MGERAGYRIRGKDGKTSMICRRQWYFGGTKEVLEQIVTEVAKNLMDTGSYLGKEGQVINGGGVALRHDLRMDRMFPALVKVICVNGFESIHRNIRCDIDDHGLFEIEMLEWNRWAVNHYSTCRKKTEEEIENDKANAKEGEYQSDYKWGELQKKVLMGTVTFEEGKTLEEGMKFEWAETPEF